MNTKVEDLRSLIREMGYNASKQVTQTMGNGRAARQNARTLGELLRAGFVVNQAYAARMVYWVSRESRFFRSITHSSGRGSAW